MGIAHAPKASGLNTGRVQQARVALCLLAVILIIAPRLLAAASLRALDAAPQEERAPYQHAELAEDNFPGSAFFYAEGAFVQAPEVIDQPAVPHVLPLRTAENSALEPFLGLTAIDRARALNCLTNAVYYEAANEPDEGQRAVAQVVLNRVRHPAWPNTVCGVVYQGAERTDMRCQFTFACDGSMARPPMMAKWVRARMVAARALAGENFGPVGRATYYHTLAVRPDWRLSLDPVAVVGAHIFYEMRGYQGTASAFRVTYMGRELISGPPASSYLPRKQLTPLPSTVAAPLDIPVYSPFVPPATLSTQPAASQPAARSRDKLPESTIKAEYRNTGRPLI